MNFATFFDPDGNAWMLAQSLQQKSGAWTYVRVLRLAAG